MYVLKRNGQKQVMRFDKITARLKTLIEMQPVLDQTIVDPVFITQKVVQGYVRVESMQNACLTTCLLARFRQTFLWCGDLAN